LTQDVNSAIAGEPGAGKSVCGHELVEHTADIGIRCWGATPAELFREAALALFEVILGPAVSSGEQELVLDLQASSHEELLVAWLNELLYRFEIEGFLPGEITFAWLEEKRLHAQLTGEHYDQVRWPLERQVKAATYHLLEIERPAGGWRATIYLDL
jgi:protein archease